MSEQEHPQPHSGEKQFCGFPMLKEVSPPKDQAGAIPPTHPVSPVNRQKPQESSPRKEK